MKDKYELDMAQAPFLKHSDIAMRMISSAKLKYAGAVQVSDALTQLVQ